MRIWLLQVVFLGFVLLMGTGSRSAWGGAMEDGKAAMIKGDYAAAIARWSKLIVRSGKPQQRLEALIRRGEAYKALGHYRDAQTDFQEARISAQKAGDALLEIVATHGVGNIYFLQRNFVAAEQLLRFSLAQALQLQHPELAAANANSLGNVLSYLGRIDKAKVRYEQTLALAQQAGDPGMVVAARLNLARLLPGEQSLAKLRAAREGTAAIAVPYERADLLLGIAVEAEENSVLHYQVLQEALSIAEDIGAPRLQSLAAGHLATFYENQGRFAKAHTFTEQAIQVAQTLNAHELLLRWEGQLGRLMRRQANPTAAIDAYRRAIYHFQNVRQDISLAHHDGRSSFFRETLAPIYLGLVDLLLQQAATETNAAREQSLLREARKTVEQIKVSELQDYFRDPCIVAQSEEIEVLSPTTAVLYPIVLPNRLELLVSIGRRLYRSTSAVDNDRLANMVMNLSFRLREGLSFRPEARRVYRWLIQPIIPILEEHAVDTLVFVPDGPLRLVPIAALGDGQRYLVEHYAITVAPGLTLLDPRPLPRQRLQILLAGLSRPGPVVDKLPNAMLESLIRVVPQRTRRQRRGMAVTVNDLQSQRLVSSASRAREARASEVAKGLELPGVKHEINQLARQFEGTVLLDDEFQLDRFVSEVESHFYRVVHIASHGFFGITAEDSFILTYDDMLDMNGLASLLQPKQLAERPVELLALSACQTAEGNDRTPLGLSGVALKSGARSALGSLWPVYDEAARQLLPAFYAQLSDPGVTKAQALQQAQLQLIRSEELAHPTFWAAFILVGNWL